MASRGDIYPIKYVGRTSVIGMAGSITTDGSGLIDVVSVPGVASVIKSGTGTYTMTLDNSWYDLVYFECMMADATTRSIGFNVDSDDWTTDIRTNKQIKFLSYDTTTAAAANVGSSAWLVHILVVNSDI